MTETYLLSFLYTAALMAQKQRKNFLIIQKKSWTLGVNAVRTRLFDLGVAL